MSNNMKLLIERFNQYEKQVLFEEQLDKIEKTNGGHMAQQSHIWSGLPPFLVPCLFAKQG